MEFRLTYSGELLSTANDSFLALGRRAGHKHDIRRAFHPQLKRLWEITDFLRTGDSGGPQHLTVGDDATPSYKAEDLAAKHAMFGWNFVPLVSRQLHLICAVDVLFLRPQRPGGVVGQGDIDGRLKTLLDALSIPDSNQGYEARTPAADETPLYVLLEEDRLITKVAVETDQLLEFVTPKQDVNEARLVITVRIRPYEMHAGNLQFA